MEQQIQPVQTQPAQAKPEIQQPAGEQTQPVKKKKPKWLVWLILALVIVVGAYFLGRYLNLF